MSTTAAPTTTPSLPLTPGLRRVLTGVVLLAVVAGIAGGANALLEVMARKTTTVPTRTFDDVRAVRIDADAGDVTVRQGGAGSSVRVRERVTRGLRAPDRRATVRAGTLSLRDGCAFWTSACAVGYEVTVPPGTTVTPSSDSGNVTVTGLRTDAPVRARSDAGSVRLSGVRAPSVDARADSGSVRLTRVVAPTVTVGTDSGGVGLDDVRARTLDASTDSGGLRAWLPAPPRLLSMRTDSGGAGVFVPAGGYRIDGRSDSGDVGGDDAVRNDPRAARRLVLRTDSGGIDYQAIRRDTPNPLR